MDRRIINSTSLGLCLHRMELIVVCEDTNHGVRILELENDESLDRSELAAYTVVASAIVNLSESIQKN
jgi:hypothetical protein